MASRSREQGQVGVEPLEPFRLLLGPALGRPLPGRLQGDRRLGRVAGPQRLLALAQERGHGLGVAAVARHGRFGPARSATRRMHRRPRQAPPLPPPGTVAPSAVSAARPPAPRPPPARARPPATAPARRSGRPSVRRPPPGRSPADPPGSGSGSRRHSATSSASAPQPSSRAFGSARSAAPARWITSSVDLPTNGGCPVRMAHRMPPSANTSARASAASPRACSGAMYAGVPITVPACVVSIRSMQLGA